MRGLRLILLFVLIPVLAAAQQDDKGYLTRLLQDNLSGAGRVVTIDGFQGALSSRASLTRMTIADATGVWLTLQDVSLDWNRAALLRGSVEINSLTAGEITLLRAPVTDAPALSMSEARGFRLPDLPVSVSIGALTAAKVNLGAALFGQSAQVSLTGALQLAAGEGEATLAITRTDGIAGTLTLQSSYGNASRQLSLNLAVSESPGGITAALIRLPGAPSVALSISGTGPIDDYTATLSLRTDDQDRLGGTVRLISQPGDDPAAAQNRFEADLSGDIAPLFARDYRSFFGPSVTLTAAGARMADGRLQLSGFDLHAQSVDLKGALSLGPDGLPETVDITGVIAAPDGAPLLLPLPGDRVQVKRAALALQFDAAISDQWTGSFDLQGFQRGGFGAQSLSLAGTGRISRPAGGAQSPASAANASFSFAATGLLPANPALAEATGSTVSGTSTITWAQGSPLTLSGFMLTGTDYALNLSGTLGGLDTGLRFTGQAAATLDSTARLSALAGRPLAGALLAEASGSYELLSGIFDLNASLQGESLAVNQPELDRLLKGASTITLSATRTEQGTTLRGLSLSVATLQANATGTLNPDATDIAAHLVFSDLSALGAPYGGTLIADARLSGQGTGPTLDLAGTGTALRTGIPELDRLLQGNSKIAVTARPIAGGVDLQSLTLSAASLAVQASGLIKPGASTLTADLNFTDLGILGPQYGGALRARADLAQAGTTQTLDLTGTGTALQTGQSQLDQLLKEQTTLSLQASRNGSGVVVQNLLVKARTLTATVTGTIDPTAITLAADLGLADLSALGLGYRGALTASGSYRQTGTKRAVSLMAQGSGLAIGQPVIDRLLSGATTLDLGATEDQGTISISRFRLNNPNLTAEATGSQTGGTGQVAIKARIADMALLAPGFTGPLMLDGTLRDGGGGPYALNLAATGPGGLTARITGTTARNFTTAALAITGQGDAALANGFIEPRTLQGPLRFDLALNGTARLANLTGSVSTTGARLVTGLAGVVLDQLAGNAVLSGGRAQVTASAHVAGTGGQIALSGPVSLTPPFVADLAVRLAGVTLRDPNLYQTTLNGTLSVKGPLRSGARIAGQIDLGQTEVNVPSTGLGGSFVLPDLAHLNEPAAVRATRARAGLLGGKGGAGGTRSAASFPLDITLNAPNRVFIRGRGLDAELGGSVRLTGTTAAIQPVGEFRLIRGRLDILGKRFTLDEGLARLQGQFIPYIQLTASTARDGVTTSIVVEGDATSPAIRFTSSPELPEEEVLARLLFGRALTAISPLQAAQLASAVATLAGRGGEGIIGRIRKNFGLDDLDLQTDSTGNTALRLGKYISEQVYTDVTIGADGKSDLSINLDLSPSVTVRGAVSTDGNTGLGVFFEKDY